MEHREQYMKAVEELTRRAIEKHPDVLVLFTSPDNSQYEIYGTDAIHFSKRMNTELLTGREYAFYHCTKIPAAALHVVTHIAMEEQRGIYIQEPIKIHDSLAPMQGLFSLN